MADPATIEEHGERCRVNYRITSDTVHLCCPFCGGPDFITYPTSWDTVGKGVKSLELIQQSHTCQECKRSGKIVPAADGSPMFVQTGGPDAPPYLKLQRQS